MGITTSSQPPPCSLGQCKDENTPVFSYSLKPHYNHSKHRVGTISRVEEGQEEAPAHRRHSTIPGSSGGKTGQEDHPAPGHSARETETRFNQHLLDFLQSSDSWQLRQQQASPGDQIHVGEKGEAEARLTHDKLKSKSENMRLICKMLSLVLHSPYPWNAKVPCV